MKRNSKICYFFSDIWLEFNVIHIFQIYGALSFYEHSRRRDIDVPLIFLCTLFHMSIEQLIWLYEHNVRNLFLMTLLFEDRTISIS